MDNFLAGLILSCPGAVSGERPLQRTPHYRDHFKHPICLSTTDAFRHVSCPSIWVLQWVVSTMKTAPAQTSGASWTSTLCATTTGSATFLPEHKAVAHRHAAMAMGLHSSPLGQLRHGQVRGMLVARLQMHDKKTERSTKRHLQHWTATGTEATTI